MMCAISRRRGSQGMTLIELIIVITLAAILLAAAAGGIYRAIQNANAIFTLTWTQAPATISPAPLTGRFVYHVTRQIDKLSPVENYAGRTVKFDRAVTKRSGTIESCNGIAVAKPSTTCTTDSDASGNLTVVVSLEKDGEATLTPTDTKTGKSDPPQAFSAP